MGGLALWLGVGCLSPAAAQAPPTVVVDSLHPAVQLPPGSLYLFPDTAGTATFADIQAASEHFQPTTAFLPARQRDLSHPWWLRLTLENRTEQPTRWWLNVPGDEVQAWLTDSSGTQATLTSGYMRFREEKAVPLRYEVLLNYLPIYLEPGAALTLWARVHHTTRYAPNFGDPTALLDPMYARWQLSERRAALHLRSGFLLAIFGLAALVGLIYFVYRRAWFAGFFALNALLEIAHFQLLEGYWYAWHLVPAPWIRLHLLMLLAHLIAVAGFAVMRSFLQLHTLSRFWDRIFKFLIVWMLAFGVALLLTFEWTGNYGLIDKISGLNGLLVLFLLVVFCVRLFLTRTLTARIYAVALLCFTLGNIVSIWLLFTTADREAILFARRLGVMVYMVIMLSGLIYLGARTEREKLAAQQARQLTRLRLDEERRLSDMKTQFLANISHEFRTPLTLLFGPLNDLVQGRFGVLPGAARAQLTKMQRNSHRLLRLINQLLDLSRLDAEAMTLQTRRHDLNHFARLIVAQFESLATVRGLTLCYEGPKTPLPFAFDADKVEKILTNLVSNALKFTEPGGQIWVHLTQEPDGATRLVVRDTGVGIAPEHQAHLFDRFYQVDTTTRRRYEGSGIGLALAHELVTLHGGTLTVESAAGVGTAFTVRLPQQVPSSSLAQPPTTVTPLRTTTAMEAADAALEAADTTPPAKPADIKEDATLVLIVEDNADMRAYLRAHLEKTYTVAEAAHGKEGLDRACALVPDLVVADVMMPEMDGFALCGALKTDARTSHIPVILLTARADAESRLTGITTGADAYLAKPFLAEELLALADNLIEGRRALRAKFSQLTAEDPAAAVTPALPPAEAAFLASAQALIAQHFTESTFSVDQMAAALNLSGRQLRRKVKSLTDTTPLDLIRHHRITHAARLLRHEGHSVKEAAYAVGYSSTSHFSRAFSAAYGMPPSAYAQQSSSLRPTAAMDAGT